MGFFSKKITTNKITTDKITETLMEFFETDYNSLVDGIKGMIEKEQGPITEEQNKELLICLI